mgnify:CR=1 FL=1
MNSSIALLLEINNIFIDELILCWYYFVKFLKHLPIKTNQSVLARRQIISILKNPTLGNT